MAGINANYPGFSRLKRPPILKWLPTPEEEGKTPNVPDAYETSKMRIFTATWNMAGKVPSLEEVFSLI